MRIFEQFRAGEKINDKELQMQKADGTHVWVSLSVNQIRGGGDQILESRSMVVDITDRKEAEEKLQESEKYFKEITENSSDIIIITDKNGAIKYCSRSVERFTGYKPGELIGRNALKLIHPDDVKRAISDFGKAILSADSAIPNAFRIVHKDGSERYFDGLGRNLLDNPAIAGFIMNVRDMTERKKAEVLLQASEERSRELAELLPETVFEMNLQGMLTFVNMRAVNMFGYTRQEFIQGLAALDTVIPDDREQAQKNIQRILHGENFGSQEYTMLRKDGGTFPALIRTTVIIRHGKPDGLRGTVVDITERKKAEEKLKETLERLRKAIGATIQVMVSAIERRDPYTAGHQSRSATLARTIATEMGLPQEKIEGIRIASSIHDIGKLSIPAEILSKPTKLSELEFALIKEHSRQGYEILKNVESSWALAEIVYQHHERMDGSGYPRNLKGDDILLEARILAVADVVEAMASNRPYRPGKGIETALEEIEKNKGLLYDDAVANVCLRLFREKGYKM
jgi:PAS domain S-box-containing protein